MGCIIVEEAVFDQQIAGRIATNRSPLSANVGGEITIFDNGGPAVG